MTLPTTKHTATDSAHNYGTIRNPIQLVIPEGCWEDDSMPSEEETRLSCTLQLAGTLFHVQAYQVDEHGDLVSAHFTDELDSLYSISGDAGSDRFATVEIGGKDYVVFMTPFQQ